MDFKGISNGLCNRNQEKKITLKAVCFNIDSYPVPRRRYHILVELNIVTYKACDHKTGTD